MKILQKLAGALLIAGMAVSCGSPAEKSDKETVIDEVTVDTVTMESSELMLPSIIEIGDIFKSSGLQYKSGITHSVEKADQYNTSSDNFLIIGVYWSDLTYCTLNDQTQEARKYFKAVKELSEKTGLTDTSEDEELIERFENNIDNKDSIREILIHIDARSDEFLDNDQDRSKALLVFLGGWTEAMYLGVETTPLDEKSTVTPRLIEQMVLLEELKDEIKKYTIKSVRVDKLKVAMDDLYNYYSSIPAIADHKGSYRDINIPMVELNAIGEKIVAMRNIITE